MRIYKEVLKHVGMNIQSLKSLEQYGDSEKFKKSMCTQSDAFEEYRERARAELDNKDIEDAESMRFFTLMTKAGLTFSAMINRDDAHIARLLIDNYTESLNDIQTIINDMTKSEEEVPLIAKDIVKSYEKFIKTLRTFL